MRTAPRSALATVAATILWALPGMAQVASVERPVIDGQPAPGGGVFGAISDLRMYEDDSISFVSAGMNRNLGVFMIEGPVDDASVVTPTLRVGDPALVPDQPSVITSAHNGGQGVSARKSYATSLSKQFAIAANFTGGRGVYRSSMDTYELLTDGRTVTTPDGPVDLTSGTAVAVNAAGDVLFISGYQVFVTSGDTVRHVVSEGDVINGLTVSTPNSLHLTDDGTIFFSIGQAVTDTHSVWRETDGTLELLMEDGPAPGVAGGEVIIRELMVSPGGYYVIHGNLSGGPTGSGYWGGSRTEDLTHFLTADSAGGAVTSVGTNDVRFQSFSEHYLSPRGNLFFFTRGMNADDSSFGGIWRRVPSTGALVRFLEEGLVLPGATTGIVLPVVVDMNVNRDMVFRANLVPVGEPAHLALWLRRQADGTFVKLAEEGRSVGGFDGDRVTQQGVPPLASINGAGDEIALRLHVNDTREAIFVVKIAASEASADLGLSLDQYDGQSFTAERIEFEFATVTNGPDVASSVVCEVELTGEGVADPQLTSVGQAATCTVTSSTASSLTARCALATALPVPGRNGGAPNFSAANLSQLSFAYSGARTYSAKITISSGLVDDNPVNDSIEMTLELSGANLRMKEIEGALADDFATEYDIVVQNEGPEVAENVRVLIDHMGLTAAIVTNNGDPFDCDRTTGLFECALPQLDPGEQMVVRATGAGEGSCTQLNAAVWSDSEDPDPSNNEGEYSSAACRTAPPKVATEGGCSAAHAMPTGASHSLLWLSLLAVVLFARRRRKTRPRGTDQTDLAA